MSRLRRVEPLDRVRHRVERFASGRPELDRWLYALARQAQRRDAARTFVVADQAGEVAGYYTLVVAQVEHAHATAAVRRGLSRHFPVPVCLIARLAVALDHQGRGVGSDLLYDALRRVTCAAQDIGIRAVTGDAIDEGAARFYRQYGFEPATADGRTLMVPIAAVRSWLAG